MRQSLSDFGAADVIVARGLVKRFGATRALDGLDLTVGAMVAAMAAAAVGGWAVSALGFGGRDLRAG